MEYIDVRAYLASIISFHFEKFTKITGYPIGIKVRHEMKT
jgi:hypothetical protein